MRTAVIDYGAGNLLSVANALRELNANPLIITSPDQLTGATHLVLPGVGSFGDCMHQLVARGWPSPLRSWIAADLPFLGICLGYQLLFESSEESPGVAGLGVLTGTVKRFVPGSYKVPHVGWNSAIPCDPVSPWWAGLGPAPFFYFVHSYFPVPAHAAEIAARTDYGGSFASAVTRGRLLATQFHPEKSQSAGLRLLRNFLGLIHSRQPIPGAGQIG